MAKALLGHVGGYDPVMLAEVRRLQRRVEDLEAQVLRLQAENDTLVASVHHDELLHLEDEPALAGTSA